MDKLKRAAGAVLNFIRTREPVVVINGATAAIAAAVAEWQGELHGQAAWVAVAFGVATFVSRALVTPAKS